MSKGNKIIYFFLASLFICGSFFVYNNFILASENNHIVINEIQIRGATAIDEFVELYNPTNSEINISGWKLQYKSDTGTTWSSKAGDGLPPDSKISPYGFFLLAGKSYNGSINPDYKHSADWGLADNAGHARLIDDSGSEIDKVGYGASVDSAEGNNPAPNPVSGQNIERRSNGCDSNNNFNDFIQANPSPQNSSSVLNNSDQNNSTNTTGDSSQDGSSQETGANGDGANSAGGETHPNPSQEGNNTAQENGAGDSSNYIPKIIITEFLPDPEDSDSDNEFIEIYNNDNIEADLAGWMLEDKIGKIKKFIIPEKNIVKAGKYKVFYSDETGIALNNSGDGIILRDRKGNIVSETPLSDSAKEDQSYALDKNGKWVWTLRLTPGRENVIEAEESDKDSDNKKQEGSAQENGNYGTEQKGSTALRDYGASGDGEAGGEQEYDFSDAIIISEIFPNPLGKDNQENNYEWIELYNTSDKDVNLKGWRIDDVLNKGSKSYIIKEDSIIKAGGYKTFSYADTRIMLNNSGDEVNILWPDGEIIDSVKYEKTIEGQSYSLASGENWIWTAEITPQKENKSEAVLAEESVAENDFEYVFAEDEEIDSEENELGNPDFVEADIKNLWHFEKYARVKVAGIVSTPPGIFAGNVFYLAGIQVFSYEIKLPKIELGDEVEVIGKISEVGGEKRILPDSLEDIKILSRNNLVEPKLISTGNANESAEGLLVIVEGKVSRIKNEVFYLDDGSGQVKIYIKPQTGIEKLEIKIGDWMVITGQASRTSSGYRILPRFQQDIKLSRVSGASVAKASSLSSEGKNNDGGNSNSNNSGGKSSLLEFLFFIIAAIVLIDWARMKKLKTKN